MFNPEVFRVLFPDHDQFFVFPKVLQKAFPPPRRDAWNYSTLLENWRSQSHFLHKCSELKSVELWISRSMIDFINLQNNLILSSISRKVSKCKPISIRMSIAEIYQPIRSREILCEINKKLSLVGIKKYP